MVARPNPVIPATPRRADSARSTPFFRYPARSVSGVAGPGPVLYGGIRFGSRVLAGPSTPTDAGREQTSLLVCRGQGRFRGAKRRTTPYSTHGMGEWLRWAGVGSSAVLRTASSTLNRSRLTSKLATTRSIVCAVASSNRRSTRHSAAPSLRSDRLLANWGVGRKVFHERGLGVLPVAVRRSAGLGGPQSEGRREDAARHRLPERPHQRKHLPHNTPRPTISQGALT